MKYYTPDKSEFHIGFEYEWQRKDESKFEKAIIRDGNQIDDIHNPIYSLRVKCLNPEDFKDLGFKIDNSWHYQSNRLILTTPKLGDNLNYTIDYNFTSKRLLINDRLSIIFSGYIFNKSEIKKLFKQLGV